MEDKGDKNDKRSVDAGGTPPERTESAPKYRKPRTTTIYVDGESLKRAIQARGWRNDFVATKAKIPTRSFAKLLAGGEVNVDFVKKLEKWLGMPLEEFLSLKVVEFRGENLSPEMTVGELLELGEISQIFKLAITGFKKHKSKIGSYLLLTLSAYFSYRFSSNRRVIVFSSNIYLTLASQILPAILTCSLSLAAIVLHYHSKKSFRSIVTAVGVILIAVEIYDTYTRALIPRANKVPIPARVQQLLNERRIRPPDATKQ